MNIKHLLNRKAVPYYRKARTSDGGGSFSFDYPVGATGSVDCRKHPAGSKELEIASQMEVRVTHIFYFEATVSLVRGDKFVLGGIDYILQVNLSPSEDEFQKWLVEEVQKGK